ncbi:MAG: hypothetical protein AB7I36_08485 [Rhodospirillaceae bacterium]
MTFSPSRILEILKGRNGYDVERAIAHLERLQREGCVGMSLGTFDPGREPRSWEAWAKAFADLHDWLAKRTPSENAADIRAGQDFLKLDAALCERDRALNMLAQLAAKTPSLEVEIREFFKGDALRYFENALHIAKVITDTSIKKSGHPQAANPSMGWTCGRCRAPVAGRFSKCDRCGLDGMPDGE